jgi:hypothetical protein
METLENNDRVMHAKQENNLQCAMKNEQQQQREKQQ